MGFVVCTNLVQYALFIVTLTGSIRSNKRYE